jgi:hypothetical protein
MPFNLPSKNSGAGAPPVDDGLGLARFDDLQLKAHDDWAGIDKFQREDDGQRYHFMFTLVDEKHQVVYHEEDPIEIEAMTRTATGEKSNFYALLSGLLTPKELVLYDEATEAEPFDASDLPGRVYNVKVSHNKKGWPFIEQVIGIAKAAK